MAKARFIVRGSIVKTQCSECEAIITICSRCKKEFRDNQAINCRKNHTCKECRKEERIRIAREITATVSGKPLLAGNYYTMDQILSMPKGVRNAIAYTIAATAVST